MSRVVAIRQELEAKVARRYGVERVYGSHREMLAQEKLDAVVAPQVFTRCEAPPPCEAREALEDLRLAREYLRLWMQHH